MTEERCRFAPTTSGPAHPGTLLAGLLCWLDARSRGARLLLRLEDVDSTRCTPESADDMRSALEWFGLDWDEFSLQSENRSSHEAALDSLAERGVLYPCSCSRSDIKRSGERAADGGWRYSGSCRERPLPKGGWRAAGETLRLRLGAGRVEPGDEGGVNLAQDPAVEMGDPVLLGRGGSIAYHLAAVADDGRQQITRVVRGRDLAASTAIHVTLQRLLGLPTPAYRHHFLLLEEAGGKLAKLHGAVSWRGLREHYAPDALCGLLAEAAALIEVPVPMRPGDLLADFDWRRVRSEDRVARWTGERLVYSV
jgi:glutamyl-tRNA synthetase/glutamyl-Q tRNA(Asp) synthetase